MGFSLIMGGSGGKACYHSKDGKGDGGFGGGGGGCVNGGGIHTNHSLINFCQKKKTFQGGGGYAGGNVNSSNGEGGTSYVDVARTYKEFVQAQAGYNAGPGYVIIIPAIEGCNCDYLCVALDEKRSETACICPDSWLLTEQKSCIRE